MLQNQQGRIMNLSDLQDSYPIYLEEDELESFDEADLNKQFEDLDLEDDEEEKPDPAMIRKISLICVKDYNSEKGKNLEFVRVKQAERFRACGGYIYCLTLIVQNDRREVSEIEKMVWQGELMEVLNSEEKSISIEQKQGKVNLLEAHDLGAALTVFRDGSLWPERVIYSQEISNSEHNRRHIKRGEGYINSSTYHVSVVAAYPHLDQSEIVIEGVVRKTKWVFPLNNDMTYSLHTWRRSTREVGPPPDSCPYSPETHHTYKRPPPAYLHDLDLISPQIVTQAWFVVENYNLNTESNLEFVKVVRAATKHGVGTTYKLIITVKDRQSLENFTTEVHEIDFASLWKCTSPFVPNEDPLGGLVPVDKRRYVNSAASK